MDLGAFSVSLAVQDLDASRRSHEPLGFVPFHGDATQNWLILKTGSFVIVDPDGNPIYVHQHL